MAEILDGLHDCIISKARLTAKGHLVFLITKYYRPEGTSSQQYPHFIDKNKVNDTLQKIKGGTANDLQLQEVAVRVKFANDEPIEIAKRIYYLEGLCN